MRVKDTLEVDKIWLTLPDKVKNFCPGVRPQDGIRVISNNFPRWQYNGAAKFTDMLIWCEQHLGNNFVWNFETVYFKTEKDKVVFLLRWE